VLGGVTMSTPYGGSEAAEVVAYLLPFSQVLQDIRPRSAPIVDGKRIALNVPWTNLVSTAGASPFMLAANDGVVTQDSMRHRDDIRLVDIACNHFDIVLSQDALAVIRSEITQVKKGRAMQVRRDRPTFSLERLPG
jgi:hypothetical protein